MIMNTKDYFAFDLHMVTEKMHDTNSGKDYLKKSYYFYPWNLPENYMKFVAPDTLEKIKSSQLEANNPINYPTGCVSYENFFTNEEMCEFENQIMHTEKLSKEDCFLPNTAQQTYSGKRLVRSKFFFGYRYMWTKC